MTEYELIEALADKEHASWTRWQKHLHSKCLGLTSFYVHGDDRERAQAITNLLSKFEGAIIIVPELVESLQRQIDTPYAELLEYEKQLDRDEVAHILPIIKEFVRGQPRDATPLEIIDLRLHRIENTLRYLDEKSEKPAQQTKLSDLVPIECETTPTEYIARLAWDKSKVVAIQRIDAPRFPDEICLGLLWQNYAQDILKHIQEQQTE